MVIYDLYLVSAVCFPNKTNPPRVIDPDAVLPAAIAFEDLKLVSRRDS